MFSLSLILSFFLLAVPATVSACEGECIVGITKAFNGNYSRPVQTVMQQIAQQVGQRLVPQHSGDAMKYLQPIINAYDNTSYDSMETAIFPSFFHGKCLDKNGNEPAGCPNPDCPIVCGTPGSLVHFYSTLRFIAFNETREILETHGSPGSDAYQQTEDAVVRAASGPARMVRRYMRSGVDAGRDEYVKKREEDVKRGLRDIMKQIPTLLQKACGGRAADSPDGLPECSWEDTMKEFILSYP
ncbi:hypothetical protein DENSPDRAFT_838798 [Dentipellis sp. KUC8613]|nr:hypothetical protein DENSPDRAFT_838798 [Dentipellis sp. KUC8613]